MLSRTLALTAAAAALATALAACGNSTTAAPLAPITLPAPGAASSSPTEQATPDVDGCSAPGYPSTSIVLERSRDLAVDVTDVAPGGARVEEAGPVKAPSSPTPFVRLDGPGMLTSADRSALLGSGGEASVPDGLLAKVATVGTPMPVGDHKMWVVYLPVRFVTGTFTLRRCGVPYNEGSSWMSMRGTYGTFEVPTTHALAVQCGTKPKNAMAAQAQKAGGCA